jgi:hypothetical protein
MREQKTIDQLVELAGLRNEIARDKQDWRSPINLFLGVAALAAAIWGSGGFRAASSALH